MVKLRFQLFSDIHIELAKRVPKIPNLSPYLFLAGDIGKIKYIKSFFPNMKTLSF